MGGEVPGDAANSGLALKALDFPEIEGGRIRLAALSNAGLADMFEYSKDPRFYEFLEFAPHRDLAETAAYLEKLTRRCDDGLAYYWFIRERATSKVVGTFGVHGIDQRRRSAQIGYGLAPFIWGRGYFSEVLSVVLPFLHGPAGLHRISATTMSDNLSSLRALERAGFRREALMRNYYRYEDGRWADAVLLAHLSESDRS